MDKNYKVKVNSDVELEFKLDEIQNLDAQPLSHQRYHVLKENTSFKA